MATDIIARGMAAGVVSQVSADKQAVSEDRAAVEAAKADVLNVAESIPEDYSTLSADVGELKSDLSDLKCMNVEEIFHDFANGSWSNSSSGSPIFINRNDRLSFRELYFLEKGTTIKITGSTTQKYAIAQWRKNSDGTWTNLKYSSWYTNSQDYVIAEDSYLSIASAWNNEKNTITADNINITITIIHTKSKLLATVEKNASDIADIRKDELPNYYFDNDYIISKVDEINQNMNGVGINGESFVFITDPHWDLGNAKQSPNLIRYIKENTNIDGFICGGDIINEGEKDTMILVFLDFINSIKNVGFDCPIAFGNHDMNTNANNPQAEWFDRNTVFNLEYKQALKYIDFLSPNNDFSFIYDKKETKTRFLFIDTQTNGSVKWEAITAISESFNNVPEDYKVIVVAHWILASATETTSWGKRICDTIDAYNARGTYENDQTRTYDYANAKGKCVLVCCGHTHFDTQLTTDGGVPILNTTCDNYNRSDSGLVRQAGTITEQAFDVVTVNYADDSVNVVRIGSGSNRTFSDGTWS